MPKEKHICCDGECNHDDCCGKVEANCLLLNNMPEKFIKKAKDLLVEIQFTEENLNKVDKNVLEMPKLVKQIRDFLFDIIKLEK